MNSKSFAFLSLLATLTTTLPAWGGYTFENGVLDVNGDVDLAGEALKIEGITSVTGSGTFTNSGAVVDLTLGLDTDVKLSTVTIEGNIRLVKTGPEMLTLPKSSSYKGGTLVKVGKLTADSGTTKQLKNFKPFGEYGTIITVEAGGTLNLKGYYNWQKHYSIVLEGGTLSNAAQTDSTSTVFDPDLTVTADSAFELIDGKVYSFAANADLDGNTLTMSLGGKLHWLPSAVGNGTIAVTGSSTFQVDKTAAYSGLTLNMGAPMDLQTYTLGVKDYVATYTGTDNKGTGELQVSGAFTPVSDSFYPPTMMDGSTIDLSAKEGSWAAGDTTFAEGATIAIEVGERTDLTEGGLLVTWSETEYNGRTFNLTSDGVVRKDLALQAQVGGLAVVSKSAKIPTAVWNGGKSTNALDPENWGWRDAEGHPDLPDGTYVVEIAWDKLPKLNWPETDELDYASLVFTGEKTTETVVLDGDRDWRGLGAMDIPFVLDLNGHKLYIVLPGAASVNETAVTSTAEGGELHATVATDKIHDNTSVALTGNLSLVKEGPGTFVATKYPQTYTGETVVREGTLRAADGANVNKDSTASVTNSPFGGARVIMVESAGTLDPRGSYAWGYHTINLNGGAITNTVAEKGVGTTAYNVAAENYPKPFNPTINLLADSTFATTKEFNFNGEVVADGHELEIWIASDQGLLWVPKAAENAVFVVTNGGYLKTLKNHTFSQKTATLKFMGGTVDLAGNLAVSNYYVATSVKDYQYDTRAKLKMTVAGVFTPVSQNFFGCEMLDGATIDLSGQEASWSSLSALVNSHKSTTGQGDCLDVTFAEGATVTIEVGDREFKGTEQIVAWSDGSKASAAGATFVLSAAARAKGYSLSYDENGLWIGRKGLMLLIR